MSPIRKRFPIDQSLSFVTARESISLHILRMMLQMDGREITEVRIDVRTDVNTLRQIEDQGHFHLTPDVRLQAAAEGFDPALPVLIEMRLDPNLLALLPADINAAAEVLKNASESVPVLLDASSWYVLNVSQSRGAVSTGYATTWFIPKT